MAVNPPFQAARAVTRCCGGERSRRSGHGRDWSSGHGPCLAEVTGLGENGCARMARGTCAQWMERAGRPPGGERPVDAATGGTELEVGLGRRPAWRSQTHRCSITKPALALCLRTRSCSRRVALVSADCLCARPARCRFLLLGRLLADEPTIAAASTKTRTSASCSPVWPARKP